MKKIMLSLAVVSGLSINAFSDDISDMKEQIGILMAKIEKLEKKQQRTQKTLSKVKSHDAFDNIKFGIDLRTAVDAIEYKDNVTGQRARNNSLLTNKLYLTMKSSPIKGLTFNGKLAVYNTWGSHLTVNDAPLKQWSASSKATDSIIRIKEAYFVYSTDIGEQPISFSIGRRPSTNGFLANYRENEKESGSPLAHITNMEVDAAMVRFSWDRFLNGAYTKFIYGRAHSGETENVYGTSSSYGYSTPYAYTAGDDEPVDFAIMLGDAYNNGQHQLMYEIAHIFNTKGKKVGPITATNKALSAGVADLYALSYKMDGVGDEISDFLDETTLFASIAGTNYNARNGYTLLGSKDGGSRSGYSYWLGAIFPDMITEDGKFGLEYNHGSKYWTPMTWAEDTAIGSKIAVRGDAYEAYWNFNLFGVKYLPSQIRYTYVKHDYTPNINCAGWVTPVDVDITSQNLRASISYRY